MGRRRRQGSRSSRRPCAFRSKLSDRRNAMPGVAERSDALPRPKAMPSPVVASKAGQPTNPAWFHNLMANPETMIQIGADVRRVRARLAIDEERDHLWPKLVATLPA